METSLEPKLLTYDDMFDKEPGFNAPRIDRIGYPNTAVICRNIQELINVISHGAKSKEISEEDAQKVAKYLVDNLKAETITLPNGSVQWNIHPNKDAAIPLPKLEKNSSQR